MKYSKTLSGLLFFALAIILFSNLTFGIGVYQLNGQYTYYTNNSLPKINLNVSSPFESITLANASFDLFGNSSPEFFPINDLLQIGQEKTLTFTPLENITSSSLNYFKLYAFGNNDGKEIIPMGDPTSFYIKLDTIKPTLVNHILPSYKISGIGSKFLNFDFDEPIQSYQLILNGKIIKSYINPSKFIRDFKSSFSLNFSSSELIEGNNNVTLSFKDLAGNSNSVHFNIFFRGPPLKIILITNKVDPNLKYFYNPAYSSFFQKTIYSSASSYKLEIKTSKKADCYLSSTLSQFIPFSDVLPGSREKFQSTDGLTHTIQVNANSNIWVACQNPVFSDDIAYLSSALNISNSLIKLKVDNGEALQFTKTFPDRELTSKFFDVMINTNKRAECFYKLDNQKEVNVLSIDDLSHTQRSLSIADGSHQINFRCFDVLGNQITKHQDFNVDSKKGILIYGNFPMYTLNQIQKVNFSVSENVPCKYSLNPNLPAVDFANLSTNISGSDFNRDFTTGTLNTGNNSYYIYCDKNQNIIKNVINIIYDPNGPSLSNLSFINNGVASNFASNLSKMEFRFNVTSLSPIKNYFIELVKSNNDSIFMNSSSNDVSLNMNLVNLSSIKVKAQNILGANSSVLEKKVLFDLNPPQVNVLMNGKTFKITCFDAETGCYKVDYGLSKTKADCVVNNGYAMNSSIGVAGNQYVCIKAYDMAQNLESVTKALLDGFSMPTNFSTTTFNSTQNVSTNSTGNNSLQNSTSNQFFNQTDYGNTSSNPPSNNLVLVAAIFILLAGVSGSGYYAYSKGYLNDQLKKMGIKNLPRNSSSNSSSASKTSNNGPLNFLKKNEEKADYKKVKKSNYDEHLNKLNKFIDEKINKSNNVFDKFDTDTHKGTVEGYDDTLINLKKEKRSNIEKDDFDEFYASSKEAVNQTTSNLEKESEAFEKYYKEKKTTDSKKKK